MSYNLVVQQFAHNELNCHDVLYNYFMNLRWTVPIRQTTVSTQRYVHLRSRIMVNVDSILYSRFKRRGCTERKTIYQIRRRLSWTDL